MLSEQRRAKRRKLVALIRSSFSFSHGLLASLVRQLTEGESEGTPCSRDDFHADSLEKANYDSQQALHVREPEKTIPCKLVHHVKQDFASGENRRKRLTS